MKSKITPKLIKDAKEYALSGFTHRQIAKSLNISPTTLYKNVDIMNTINKAEDELRRDIAQDIRTSSNNGEVSAQIFLSKRLNLYSTTYKMPQIKTVKTALTQISRINSDLANGVLPVELANNLIKNIDLFLKAFEVNELEKRIEQLEFKNEV